MAVTKRDLQIQCNSHQTYNDILHRNRNNSHNRLLITETEINSHGKMKCSSSQSNSEGAGGSNNGAIMMPELNVCYREIAAEQHSTENPDTQIDPRPRINLTATAIWSDKGGAVVWMRHVRFGLMNWNARQWCCWRWLWNICRWRFAEEVEH